MLQLYRRESNNGMKSISGEPGHPAYMRSSVPIDNFVYEGRLIFDSLSYYRSGHAYLHMPDGTHVQMLLTEFAKLIPKMEKGCISGRFTWKKQGPATNLYIVTEEV